MPQIYEPEFTYECGILLNDTSLIICEKQQGKVTGHRSMVFQNLPSPSGLRNSAKNARKKSTPIRQPQMMLIL